MDSHWARRWWCVIGSAWYTMGIGCSVSCTADSQVTSCFHSHALAMLSHDIQTPSRIHVVVLRSVSRSLSHRSVVMRLFLNIIFHLLADTDHAFPPLSASTKCSVAPPSSAYSDAVLSSALLHRQPSSRHPFLSRCELTSAFRRRSTAAAVVGFLPFLRRALLSVRPGGALVCGLVGIRRLGVEEADGEGFREGGEPCSLARCLARSLCP